MGNEPNWLGHYPGLGEALGEPFLPDDFSGWGRYISLRAGDADFKTVCEMRLDQRWAGRHGHRMPENPSAREFLQGMESARGTDAPSANCIFLRNDNPDIAVTAQIEYGSGGSNDLFFCSVGAGTHVFVPGTYWRVSMRVDQIAIGAAAAYPATGTTVVVGACIGRGTGADNTRPHLDQYINAPANTPRRVNVPPRADRFRFHFGPTIAAGAAINEIGLGASVLAEYRGPLVQDFEYQIWPGARQIVFDPAATTTSGIFRFYLA